MIATLHFHSKLSGKYERSFSLYRLFFPEKLEKVRVYWRLSLISPDLVLNDLYVLVTRVNKYNKKITINSSE